MTARLPHMLSRWPDFLWGVGAILIGLAAGLLSPLWALFLVGIVIAAPLFAMTPLTALGAMLILAPLRTLVSTEAAFKPPLDSGQITFLLYLASWAVYRIAHRQPLLRFKPSPVYIPIMIFTVAGGLTAWSALSLGSWITEWLKWWIILVMVYTLLSMGRHVWTWVIGLLVLSGVANALVGIYIFFGGSGADHLVIPNLSILGHSLIAFRAFGTFGQPNPFGGFLGLLTPLALMMAYGYVQRVYVSYRAARVWPKQDVVLLLLIVGQIVFWRACLSLLAAWQNRDAMARALIIGAMGAMAALLAHGLIDNSVYVLDLVYIFMLLWAIPSVLETIETP
jgi:hypothetical protein